MTQWYQDTSASDALYCSSDSTNPRHECNVYHCSSRFNLLIDFHHTHTHTHHHHHHHHHHHPLYPSMPSPKFSHMGNKLKVTCVASIYVYVCFCRWDPLPPLPPRPPMCREALGPRGAAAAAAAATAVGGRAARRAWGPWAPCFFVVCVGPSGVLFVGPYSVLFAGYNCGTLFKSR